MKIIAFILVVLMVWLAWPHVFPPAPEVPVPNPVATSMSSAEQTYYLQVFDYTMDNVKPNQSYGWESYNARGDLSVSDIFTSKSGSTCRKFSENIEIGRMQATNAGIGCKRRGDAGWCRLKDGDALTCAMEKNEAWLGFNVPVVTNPLTGARINMPGGNFNSNMDTNINTRVDINGPQKGYGVDPADTVTGAAGSVAGPATTAIKGWFSNAFTK